MTREEIEAQLRIDYAGGIPVYKGGGNQLLAPGTPEFEQRIEAMADAMFAKQGQDAIQAKENDNLATAKLAYPALKAGTATNAQVQRVVAFLLRQAIPEIKSESPL